MEERILNEIRYTIDDMKEKTSGGQKILTRVDKYFDLPDLNVIWELVAATRSVIRHSMVVVIANGAFISFRALKRINQK